MIVVARGVSVNPALVSAVKDAGYVNEPWTNIILIDGQHLTVQASYAAVMEALNIA